MDVITDIIIWVFFYVRLTCIYILYMKFKKTESFDMVPFGLKKKKYVVVSCFSELVMKKAAIIMLEEHFLLYVCICMRATLCILC